MEMRVKLPTQRYTGRASHGRRFKTIPEARMWVNINYTSSRSVSSSNGSGLRSGDGKHMIMYSIEKHRARRVRTKTGNYKTSTDSEIILYVTHVPVALLEVIGKKVKQGLRTWEIVDK